ncbi:MAG: 1-deoxy-D-xylulose-5-phosphate synthase [Deferribacterota bacterium]|nr:1-deoxy-D-xylulose-5-phosphate synthase [Deferribacterota bacterium]
MSILYRLNSPNDLKKLSYKELGLVATEVRDLIIKTVAKNGGHLASSLGTVELTIALLRYFDIESDKIIWDVGHQAYPFKILTDRRDNFHTLRQYKGISGFIKSGESPYDIFSVGHAATSISASLGLKCGMEYLKEKGHVIAVIGDGSLSSGLALEAINNLNNIDKQQLIIILNDNDMCISPNIGGISSYLSKIMSGEIYTRFRKDIKNFFKYAPLGDHLLQFAKKLEEGIISLFTPGIFFEVLGLKYIGPVNGHNIKAVEDSLHNAAIQYKPVLIHVRTKKGKGYKPAEEDPSKFHSISSFDISTGATIKIKKEVTYSEVAGKVVCDLASKDDKVVALTAAMTSGVGLNDFKKNFPNRFYDVGIAEEHGVVFSAGLAKAGLKPYYFIYSTFLQRAFDQIIHDVALQNLPVSILIDRAGLVGADGPTHHGVFDISMLRQIPNFVIMAPKDKFELEEMIKLSHNLNKPVAIRYPKGEVNNYNELNKNDIVFGKSEVIFNEGDIALVSVGHIFSEVFRLYKMLKEEIGSQTLINLRFIKPLDIDNLSKVLINKKLVVIAEENVLKGGAGEEITVFLNEISWSGKVLRFGFQDIFIEHGKINELRSLTGISAESMYKKLMLYIKEMVYK